MNQEQVEQWLKDEINLKLFKPNMRPNSIQSKEVFEVANYFEPGKHKPTSCGRCYGNAIRAIKRHTQIF